MNDVSAWLELQGLAKYAAAFLDNEIEIGDLSELSDADLRELGLPMGPRRRFLRAARAGEGVGDDGLTLPPQVANEAERRQLTVMFADLVGSTELAQRLDPEDLREINRRYQEAARQAIETGGGFVARYMGDGVLAYFGFPVVHEDDPERAVRAALALIAALEAPVGEQRLALRIGIATGPVVVGDLIGEGGSRENAVVGETPNLAARLQALAAPGSVMVAEVTRRLIGGAFRFEALAARQVKGFAEPITPFRVGEENVGRSRFDSRSGANLSPFIGREEELALLRRRWQRAEAGEGGAVLMVGEPGIGKSRITDQLRLEARAGGGLLLLFQCSSYHRSSAFHPLLATLESMLLAHAAGEALTYATVRDYFAGHPGAGADLQVSLLAGALGLEGGEEPPALALLDADARRRHTLAALTVFVERYGGDAPLLCVFEDLHWADPSTLELLTDLVERLAGRSILLIATTRPDLRVAWGDLPHCRVMSLSRLDDVHSSALASVAAELSPEVLAQVLDRAGGNPLYIEELAQAWMDVAARATAGSDHPIPATLHDSLMARLESTGPGRAVAQCASILGREFSREMLAAIWDRDPEALDAGLSAVLDAGLVYARSDVQGDREYLFKHALVCDAARNSMLRERRRTLHQRAADRLLERSERSRRSPSHALIAQHLGDAGNRRAALEHWLHAGEAAARTSSYRECEEGLRRGLALIEDADDPAGFEGEELELLVVLGPALMAQYGYSAPSVGEVYERARVLCESLEGKPHLAPVLNGLRLHYICRYGSEAGFEPSRALLAHADARDDDASRIEGYKALGSSMVWTAQFDEARDLLVRAIALYDRGENMDVMRVDSDSGLTCHSFAALVEWASGFGDRSRRHSEQAMALAERSRRTFGLGEALSFRALLLFLCRDYAKAEATALEARRLAEAHNYVLWTAMSSTVMGASRVGRGDVRAGMDDLQRAGRILDEMGYVLWKPFYLTELGHGHGCAGELDLASERFDEAAAMVARTEEHFWVPDLERRRGQWLLHGGRADAAERVWRRGIDTAAQHKHRIGALRIACDLARHWIAVGRATDARELLAPIHAAFNEGFESADLGDACTLLDSIGLDQSGPET